MLYFYIHRQTHHNNNIKRIIETETETDIFTTHIKMNDDVTITIEK